MAVAHAPAKELAPLLEEGLEPRLIADLTGRSIRTAERWVSGETAPKGEARERLVEVGAVLEALTNALPGADGSTWLERPNLDLDFSSPADLIGRGEAMRVLALLTAIGEGAYL